MGKTIRETGVKDGKCSKCGANVIENRPKFVGHGDGEKEYCNMFQCPCCDNMIIQHFKRDRREWR